MSLKKSILNALAVALTAGALSVGGFGVHAQEQDNAESEVEVPEAANLEELLDMVREGVRKERARMDQRVEEFRQNQAEQEQRLAEARQELKDEEERSSRLEKQHSDNEIRIAELEKQLKERLGEFGELFGVTRQVAGDLRGIVESSVVSAEYQGREKFLSEFAGMDSLPQVSQIRELWFQLMQQMKASGEVHEFTTNVVLASGEQVKQPVVRVGSFNAVSNGQYLEYQAETGNLVELARQPAGRFLSMAQELQNATEGRHAFGIDPSRGSILSLLVQTPNWRERVDQGGFIGYLTISLGVIGALLAIFQFFYLLFVGNRVRAQMKSDQPNENNPLGRVLKVYEDNKGADVETLELKMDEAILRNTPPLERFLTIVKVLAVVAPLLGLLGTVTGMINTFQAITLFGTGDPKLMAGGISQALVTTMLGLTVAIPLTFLHTLVQGRSRSIIHILEEQAAGIVAVHAEKK